MAVPEDEPGLGKLAWVRAAIQRSVDKTERYNGCEARKPDARAHKLYVIACRMDTKEGHGPLSSQLCLWHLGSKS